MANPIVTENALTGDAGWWITNHANNAMQVYASTTSVAPGGTVTFYQSGNVGGIAYTIKIYRLGWYAGVGGRLIATISGLTGVAQGYWDGAVLQSCPSAIINGTTHLLETGWASATTWTVPANAVTGVYVAIFTNANTLQNACSFVVTGNTTADYVVIRPYTTDAAYNNWGGYSLYTNPTVGVAVSFNRPDVNGYGTGGLFRFEIPLIHWLESQGYNLSYLSDVDVHVSAAQLLSYKAMVFCAHDEYWTKAMYDGVQAAIAAGVGAAFTGANSCYWQIRFSADNAGNPNRSITCYKVSTAGGNLANDPQYGVDNTIVTAQWRDAVLNRPENAMVGIMQRDSTTGSNAAWTVDPNAAQVPYFQNAASGLTVGSSYGSDLVGYEWDNRFAGGPANLQIIGTSSIVGVPDGNSISNTAVYVASSGALVFAAGSISWTWSLDNWRFLASTVTPIAGMQTLFAYIMSQLIINHKTYANIGH